MSWTHTTRCSSPIYDFDVQDKCFLGFCFKGNILETVQILGGTGGFKGRRIGWRLNLLSDDKADGCFLRGAVEKTVWAFAESLMKSLTWFCFGHRVISLNNPLAANTRCNTSGSRRTNYLAIVTQQDYPPSVAKLSVCGSVVFRRLVVFNPLM